MSFLAPLYFLGALAVAGPIIFHLIRRQPKGEVEFSSLMFLDATPPRLTRRSRLENWPLLLLRCAAILMLAFAFARPFLPIAASDSVQGVKQAVILLVDQSASMKRSGLWDQATEKAKRILDQCDDETLISVVAFDSATHPLLSLEESTRLDGESRKGAATGAIEKLRPTWHSTDIGNAIRFAADQAALLELGDSDAATNAPNNPNASATIETRIVLLSDLQSGAGIETLQGYEWPERVWLDVETLVATTRGNTTLRVMPQTSAAEQAETGRAESGDLVRVQVSQTDDGDTSTFRLRFDGQPKDAAVIQVPPGQTRFFTVPLPQPNAAENQPAETATLMVSGDSDDFDNVFHFIRPKQIQQEVRFIESAPDTGPAKTEPRDTLSFYALQLPWSDSTRDVSLIVSDAADFPDVLDPANTPLLIFNASAVVAEKADRLEQYLAQGGRVLVVLDQPVDDSMGQVLAELLESTELSIKEAEESEYALISSVDFKSALIAPLSDPGVNDFSNIRVWKHRVMDGLADEIKVTLKLDDGSPLLITKDYSVGETLPPTNEIASPGKLWLLSTGWQPSQSQIALSTKFVPILLGMLGPNRQLAPASLVVGDRLAPGSEQSKPTKDDVATEPGIVQLDDGSKVAVNLNPSESETPAFDLNRISEFGAVVSSPASREQEESAERALRDIELEARQGWWQWLILATLGFVAAETLLAARDRQKFDGENV